MIENITQEFLNMIKLPDTKCKRLKYLLVLPRVTESMELAYQFPAGLGYVSSALKASGRDVLTLNLNYKNDHLYLLRSHIIDNNVDVIATGGISGQYEALREIIDTAKSVKPNIVTIVGGGIITADPAASMSAFENADYGVCGEGEITINALAYALETGGDASKVAGIASKYGTCPPPPEITNLDCLPFPDYEGFEFRELMNKKSSLARINNCSASVAISRSCPWNCTFCFHPSGTTYRRRSLDDVFKEIDWLIAKYGIKWFIFCDELFVDKSNFIYEFCERIKRYNVKYWAQTRVDMITKEIATIMKDSGCYIISLGVESANDNILRSMRKFTTVAQIERAFDAMIEAGVTPISNIILGDLEETPETIFNSLKWLTKHPHYSIEVFWILTFPGSYLYKVACERGIIKNRMKYLRDGQFQINVSKMSDDLYEEMANEVDLFNLMRSTGMEFDPEKFRVNLEALVESGKTAIWPATTSNVGIIHKYAPNILESDNLQLVNSNPSGAGTYIAGIDKYTHKEIHVPDIISRDNTENIVFIFRSDAFETICESINQHYPSVKRILIIDDLLQ